MAEHPVNPGMADALQMLTVASSFPMPENTDLDTNYYAWTGYEQMSHNTKHDIVFFFREDACWEPCPVCEDEYDMDGNLVNSTDCYVDPSCIDRTPVNMTEAALTWAKPDFECNPTADGEPVPGPRLGNFNYDIARSHQQYNLPIYGLDNEAIGVVEINAHQVNEPFEVAVRNVSAHHGHGETTHIDCENTFQYQVDANHGGILEYAQVTPSSYISSPKNPL